MIQLPLFIRWKLNVSNSLHNSPFLRFVKRESVMWPVLCAMSVLWRCNDSRLFFLTIQAPYYLNGSIGSLSIAAFSIFSNTLAILAVIVIKQEMNQCHERDKTGNPSRIWDGWNGKMWWTLAMASVRVTIRASESLCFCSTTWYEACVRSIQSLGPFICFFISRKNVSAAGKWLVRQAAKTVEQHPWKWSAESQMSYFLIDSWPLAARTSLQNSKATALKHLRSEMGKTGTKS